MDIIKESSVDWLKLKWVFVSVSLVLMIAGGASFLATGLNLGIDFTGGTLVFVKFKATPELERIRKALAGAGLDAQQVVQFDEPSLNEVQIRMGRSEEARGADLNRASRAVFAALEQEYDAQEKASGKVNLNSVSREALALKLEEVDPEHLREKLDVAEFGRHYEEIAGRIIDYRTSRSGIISELSELGGSGLPAAVAQALPEHFYAGGFNVISVESVGPKVGQELRDRARWAVIFSLLGMLVYIAFRFRPIYGLAAIIALFHDVLITLGAFSFFGKEISLTVVAALLTLVGYSINDTIVVFDRVRENLRLMRRANLYAVINASINQTLNRTILTSGMTFLAVFALYLFGGQVLSGFSFALVVGIIIGTYSSIAIASPIVLWWQNFLEWRKQKA